MNKTQTTDPIDNNIQEASLSNISHESATHYPDGSTSKVALTFEDIPKCSASNFSWHDPRCRFTKSVYTLPENWPKIAQMKDHLWISELTNCKTPSVKRAISHIELMQNVIDDWFLRVSEKVKSSPHNLQGCSPGAKKHLKFQTVVEENSMVFHDNHPYKITSSSRALAIGGNDMSVIGHEGYVQEDDAMQDIPYLGAEEVIEEVITLLAELENDRMETQEKYMKEIRRATFLQNKIDEMQLQHLRELPALVQREHEACLMNLTELHWHVTYTKRLQAKALSRFTILNRHNGQLKEDIDFVKKHVPLVQEKLVLEIEAMDVIRKSQGDTDQELVIAHQRQAKTEMRSQEAMTKANTERVHIAQELVNARGDLTYISDQLTEAKVTYETYVQQMSDIHKKLTENERDMEVLKAKNSSARMVEEAQATKVTNLQAKVTGAEFDHKRLEHENKRQEQVLKMNKNNHMHIVTDLEQQRIGLEGQLWKLSRKIQECNVDIQDCQEKITKCDQQKAADIKNINRIKQETERSTVLFEEASDQYQQIFNDNNYLQDKLVTEQHQTFHAEEKLKKSVESLRRQVQDEIHAKTVLQAHISSDISDTEKLQLDSDIKKGKAKTVIDELQQAVSVVLKKVVKLQTSKTEMQGLKEDLINKIKETETQHNESSERFSQTLAEIEPHHQSVKGELFGLNDQLKTMEERSVMMKKKIEEMDAAQNMMDKVDKTLQQDIKILTSEMNELTLQLESGTKIVDELRRQFKDTCERLKGNEGKHKNLQKERQEVLTLHETEKVQSSLKNKELASRYRQLQREYIIQKELMLKSYGERVKIEAAITDMKKLKSFQSKLHSALVDYFRLRGLYNRTELSKLEQVSSDNGVRVSQLQTNMQRALDHIALFLSSLSKEKTTQDVWESAKQSKNSQHKQELGGEVTSVLTSVV